LYLKGGKSYDRTDHEDMSGLRLIRVGGETIVFSVEKVLPSWLAFSSAMRSYGSTAGPHLTLSWPRSEVSFGAATGNRLR
jgi:hypothetical protein